MPRRQLLICGFRHWGVKQAQQQKAARLVTIKQFSSAAGTHKAAAYKATGQPAPPSTSQGLRKGSTGAHQDTPPSFAASALAGRTPAASEASSRIFGRLLNRLRPAPSPPLHASQAMPSAPSFAAAPLLHGQQPSQRDPSAKSSPAQPQPNTLLSAARRLAEQAFAKSTTAGTSSSSPLYRFAKLSEAVVRSPPEAPAANKENLRALKKYAELPQQQAQKGAVAAAKSAGQRALDAKALLRYAKLK